MALAALTACLDLDTEESAFYADVVRAALGEAARSALEALMQSPQHREFQSDSARKYAALGRAEGEAIGRAEGEAIGRAEGEAIGRAEGEAIGRAEGEAKALLVVLEARGLAVTNEQRTRVLACLDVTELGRWIRRAVTATATNEVFE